MRARALGRPDGSVPAAATWLLLATSLACGAGGSVAAGGASHPGPAAGPAAPPAAASPGGGADGSGIPGAQGGPGASSRCDALMPAPGPPVVADFDWPAACAGATSSPSGDVALGILDMQEAPPTGAFVLFSPDGTRLGSAAGALASAPIVDPSFHPASAGYQGMSGSSGGVHCAAWDRTGALQAIGCAGSPATSAPTAAGGSVFVVGSATAGDQDLVRTGPDGGVRSARPLGGVATLVLEAWQTGHVVAVDLSSRSPQARWFDADGDPLTGWFPVAARSPAYAASLKLLVDGTVALHDGTAWAALLRDGAASADGPPSWLVARPRVRLATIRQGGGYAALPDDLPGVARFEVLTTDGESCGSVALPADSVRRLDCGYDGTVITSEPLPPTSSGPGCRYRWWPALLR